MIFTPLEALEKLAALVPPPRVHLTRFFGCLAPHAKIRSQIVPKSLESKPTLLEPASPRLDTPTKSQRKRLSWSQLLARVFNIDIRCPNCKTELKPISVILEAHAITKILNHLGIPFKPPDIAPARLSAALEHCQN